MNCAEKQKHKILSTAEKLAILKKFDKRSPTNTLCSFAKLVGLSESSVREILQDREKLYATAMEGGSKWKKMKSGKYEKVEEVLAQWMVQCRAQGILQSGPIIKEKQWEIAKKSEVSDFCASNGLLDEYKQRHGISFHQISGELESICLETIAEWLMETVPHLTKGYEARNIFSADECALFFKLMPDKSHVLKGMAS